MIRTFVFALLALSLQANAAVVTFNPGSKTVKVGETFFIGVNASEFGIRDVDGGGFDLFFDHTVLEVIKVDIDHTAWDFGPFTDEGTVLNAIGTVTGTTFAQFNSPKVDAFHILSYEFRAIGTGPSALRLVESDDQPFSSGGVPIVVTFFPPGSVNVTAVPEPSTAALLIGGLLLVGVGASRRLQQ